jgi:hypothetical protein
MGRRAARIPLEALISLHTRLASLAARSAGRAEEITPVAELYDAESGALCITPRSALSALCGAPHKAEFERDLIRERTQPGLSAARARGRKQ